MRGAVSLFQGTQGGPPGSTEGVGSGDLANFGTKHDVGVLMVRVVT